MQNRRGILFLVLAIAMGVGAAMVAQRWLEQQRLPAVSAAGPATQAVAVIRRDTQVGAILTAREVGTVEWPLDFVPQGSFQQPEHVEGRVLKRPLAAGEPILETALLPVGSAGGLVSVIDPSLKAVSVKVDPVIGVAGFITPGSQVDVITTVKVKSGGREAYSKVILQDVKVLAIDQTLEEAREGEPQLVQVVTLEVSTTEAERLTYASHEGRLQLALRNPTDREIVSTRRVGANDLLGRAKPRVARAAPAWRPSVEVLKGANLSTVQTD